MPKITKSTIVPFILTILYLSTLPAYAKYNGGTGDPCDPYQINDPCQLNAVGTDPNDWDKHFILTANIDLSQYTREQFNIIAPDANNVESGCQGTPFTGSFDGNGHIITNFTYSTMDTDFIGIFGYMGDPCSCASVINLKLVNPCVIAEKCDYVGSLVGRLENGIITGCSVEGGCVADGKYCVGGLVGENSSGIISNCHTISSVMGLAGVGGLVGRNDGRTMDGGEIIDCYTTGSVTGDRCVGGLVGSNYDDNISYCYATGSVMGGDHAESIGGLVGENSSGNIFHCYATGSVTANSEFVGGLVGYNSSGTISNCYATGSVTITGNQWYVGGLVGENSGSITNCYATGCVSGGRGIGGLVGSNHGSVNDCYAIGSVNGYDYLGGLVGNNYKGNITNCYATGSVCGYTYLGGLVGDNREGTISNSFWNMETSGMSTSASGTGLTIDQMQDINIFLNASWDFVGETANGTADIWWMPSGWYPALAWQPVVTVPDITEMSQNEAQNAIIAAGLTIGKVSVLYSSTIPEGIIIHQSPSPDTIVGEHSSVNMMVSLGPSPYAGGNGSKNDPIHIATAAQLEHLANMPFAYSLHFVLIDDIDIGSTIYPTALIAPDTNVSFRGFQGTSFTGFFDGNGHRIINLTIDTGGTETDYLGLFGQISSSSVIKNLGLENVTIIGGDNSNYLGSLAGLNAGSITNCYTTGSISGDDYIGGLVGYSAGSITNCYTAGSISGIIGLGGLVGYNNGCITNCYATGSVTAGGHSGYLGGLVGYNKGSITNCYATGSISGGEESNRLGGLVGDNCYGSISNCYTIGSVTFGDDSDYLGGLVGVNYSGSLSNCYATGSVNGGDNTRCLGGLVGYTYRSSVSECYATGSVSGGDNSKYLGGLVGYNVYGSISNSFWDMDTSDTANGVGYGSSNGATGKVTAEMQMQSTFTDAGWDFVGEDVNGTDDFWRMCVDGIDYPKLSWQFLASDFTCPDGVEINDLMYMLDYWLENDCPGTPGCPIADINADNEINLKDFTHLAANWLLH